MGSIRLLAPTESIYKTLHFSNWWHEKDQRRPCKQHWLKWFSWTGSSKLKHSNSTVFMTSRNNIIMINLSTMILQLYKSMCVLTIINIVFQSFYPFSCRVYKHQNLFTAGPFNGLTPERKMVKDKITLFTYSLLYIIGEHVFI